MLLLDSEISQPIFSNTNRNVQ